MKKKIFATGDKYGYDYINMTDGAQELPPTGQVGELTSTVPSVSPEPVKAVVPERTESDLKAAPPKAEPPVEVQEPTGVTEQEPAQPDWIKDRTESERAIDLVASGSFTVAKALADKGFYGQSTQEEFDNVYKLAQWITKHPAESKYNPKTGDFIGEDGKAANLAPSQKVALNIVHAAAAAEGIDPTLKEKAQGIDYILWQRRVTEKGGYTFYTGEVRESVVLVDQYCLPLMRRIEEAFVARKLDKSRDPQDQETYLQIINEMRMLLNQNSGLDFDTKLQLVNELLNKEQVREVLASIPAVDARYKNQNDRVQGKIMPTQDLVAELRIKDGEVTDMGKKNLAADWLVNEMKALGINVDEAQKQAISQRTGLEVLTQLEKAGFENWANSTGFVNKIRGSIFGGAGIDLDIQSLKDLAKNKDALAIISKKFVGTSEKLSEIFGEEKMKILGRLDKKLPLEQYAMYFMILYGMLGPSIFEGLEDRAPAEAAQAAAA